MGSSGVAFPRLTLRPVTGECLSCFRRSGARQIMYGRVCAQYACVFGALREFAWRVPAKGRPAFNPLIAHVLDVGAARREGTLSAEAEKLAEAFWPGPLTLVVPAAASCRVSLLARAGLDSLALRVPRLRPIVRAASAQRRPRMFWPISTAGSTGSSTPGLRLMGSNRRSSRAAKPAPCC